MHTNVDHLVFPVVIFEESGKVSDTITKARLRTFYKGKNRNMSYISDEFADQLLSTIAYAPVKGIYDPEKEDFGSHGDLSEGKIYGIVPQDHNFAWELLLDEDGVEREYACVDVYLYTGLYEKEGKKIIGSSQSMELYGPSISGDWLKIDEDEFFVFTSGSFLGLQVLGKETLPCFEGASFYSLENVQMFSFFTSLYEKFEQLIQLNKEGGKEKVEKENEEFAGIAVSEPENTSIVDNAKETFSEATVETETYIEAKVEVEVEAEVEVEVVEIIETNFVDFEKEIATLKSENEAAQKEIFNLTEELNVLREYKKGIETFEKETILSKYEEHLDTNLIEEMREKLDSYTALELDKELSYILVKSAKNVFSHESAPYVPKDDGNINDLVSILSKYKK